MNSFSSLIEKMAAGSNTLNDIEKQELVLRARALEQAEAIIANLIAPGSSLLRVDNASITSALIKNAQITDATIHNAAITDATVNNATMTNAAITDATIVSASAGNGHVLITSGGIDIVDSVTPGNAYLTFYATDALTKIANIICGTGGMQIQIPQNGDSFEVFSKMTDGAYPYLNWGEDPADANVTMLVANNGTKGSKILSLCGTDNAFIGAEGQGGYVGLYGSGTSSGASCLELGYTTNTPSTSSGAQIYVKGGKLVVQYGSNYFYIDLSSAANQQWTYSATAP